MKKLLGKRCLIDTNILVALINKKHQHHKKAKEIFNKIFVGDFKAIISSQNLLELAAVLVHGFKISKKETAKDIDLLIYDELFTFIYPSTKSVIRFIELMRKDSPIHTVDLFLVSTALENDVEVIISANVGLQKIKNISIYNPFK